MGGRDKPGHDGMRELKRTSAALRANFLSTQTKTAAGFRERLASGAIRELERMYASTVVVARTK
jgi:hypothetical protein